ncbi:hypothetical protein BGX38DRAFT_1259285 [Terfezia claveryi]|nr:hypothetical protein BGX38DRAFT_1259285 [Terfezia claveryi]
MFRQYTFLALIALTTIAQASYYSIYDTPGPVMPQFGPDFPFHNLSKDSNEVATKISQAKLGRFCNELLSGQSDSDVNDNEPLRKPARRRLQARRTNYNSNLSFNVNSNSGSGGSVSSYSSSYSNNNGHISGIESGYPGKTGQGYSYTYSNEGTGQSGSSSHNYTLNGLRVPKELQGYTPKAIKEGCEKALSGEGDGDEDKDLTSQLPVLGQAQYYKIPLLVLVSESYFRYTLIPTGFYTGQEDNAFEKAFSHYRMASSYRSLSLNIDPMAMTLV